ncbi:MAG: FISUMP domain-containing protein [Candidatus Gracilibacteria bacterium]|nr:FISUMP domain-containing protein [Candidatus Gracilibacteria bacterium]
MKNKNLAYIIQNIELKQKSLNPKFYQLSTSKTKAFTLVELIVVIVILAILGTIAFISFQGYSRNSRDSVRIADINSAKKSLEIFITKAGFYPTPDNATNITYSGAIVWTEGTLGLNVTKNIQSLNKVITDPLTSNEYTYSITSSKTEYQIGAISEGGGLTNNTITNNVYAADLSKSSAVAYISGNYNEKFTKVNTGTTSWILAQPSIISTDKTTSTDLANILSNKKLAYNNYGNYPSSYNTPGTQSGGFNYTNGNTVIYSGTTESLLNYSNKVTFLTNLKNTYSGTVLQTEPLYQEVMKIDTNINPDQAVDLVSDYMINNVGGIKYGNTTKLDKKWRELDPNCQIDDIIVGNQVWAGCNSTLGNGVERGKKYDGTDGVIATGTGCYNYDGVLNSSSCPIGSPNMASNTSAKVYFDAMQPDGTNQYGDSEFDTIWGKFYTWVNAGGACPTGWHLPSDKEWENLETILNGGVNCRNLTDGRYCDGLGWKTNVSYNPDKKLAELLKIPLSGYCDYDRNTFFYRGHNANLWSSTSNINNAYRRYLRYTYSSINRNNLDKLYGFSVRCIKD